MSAAGSGKAARGWIERLRDAMASTPLAATRFVVVDTETSGLAMRQDRLLSIGACIVDGGRLALGESFYCEIRQESVSETQNILVHGLGHEAQLGGLGPREALEGFLAFASDSPLVAFHAPFDHAFLASAMQAHLGLRWKPQWIDLAALAPALYPAEPGKRETLDDWLARFSIETHERHNALADAACTAELLLALLAEATRQGYHDARGLRRAQSHGRWIAR